MKNQLKKTPDSVEDVICSGSGIGRVAIIRETKKNGEFIKATFRTNMSIPMHFGVGIQPMIVLMGSRLRNDKFKNDLLGHYFISGITFDKRSHTLKIRLDILGCFSHLKHKIFERSGLFPINVLELVFLSNF